MPAIRPSDPFFADGAMTAPAGIIPPRIAAGCGKAIGIVLFSLITAIGLLVATLTLLPANSFAARAAGVPSTQAPGQSSDMPPMGLFFPSGPDGSALEAPRLHSDVRINVTGMIARVAVRQRFTNPSENWQEGIYVFPLTEKSAVDRLIMTVGGRVITGKILEKEQAKRAYDAAAASGRRASLLSSERPNVFVTSLANIGPGEEITIDIEYQDSAVYRDGIFSLRFPMVVAPRYTPLEKTPQEGPKTVKSGAASPAIQTPAIFKPEDRDLFGPVGERVNPVTLTMRLDPGSPLGSLASLYHPVDIEDLDDRRKVITLREGSVPANKDFVVEWRLASTDSPQASMFVEDYNGESYVMMMVTPRSQKPDAGNLENLDQGPAITTYPPRDVVFVIDTSGSMHGASIEQARAALSLAVSRLQPMDRFNVIRFNNETFSLFDKIVPVTADSLRRAQAYVNALESDGGTEMRPALLEALKMNADADAIGHELRAENRLQQVVFLTDGAVGNEAELFRLIAEKLGSTRLFTVGIGAAPNSYFMRKAAEAGRGTFTYIGDPNEVSVKMSALLRKLERPALTHISLGWPGAAGKRIESYPSTIPDLYEGDPVVVISRITGVEADTLSGDVLLSGRQGQDTWQRRATLDRPKDAQGIAALWARSKFGEITDGLFLGRDPVAVRIDALEVALEHQLVTSYTSLVAIDDQPARPKDEALHSLEVPREMPEGWSRDKVFGASGASGPELTPSRDPASLKSKAMPVRKLPASIAAMAPSAQGTAVQLPQTATPATLNAMIGAVLVLLGALVFAGISLSRRRSGSHA